MIAAGGYIEVFPLPGRIDWTFISDTDISAIAVYTCQNSAIHLGHLLSVSRTSECGYFWFIN